jgi:hypothetical protein
MKDGEHAGCRLPKYQLVEIIGVDGKNKMIELVTK